MEKVSGNKLDNTDEKGCWAILFIGEGFVFISDFFLNGSEPLYMVRDRK